MATRRQETVIPLCVEHYMSDTGPLTTIEHGAYLLLIMQAWMRGGLLPDDNDRLRAMTRMDLKAWNRSRETIMALFRKVEGGYRHKRIDRDMEARTAVSRVRGAAGKAGAKGRWRMANGWQTDGNCHTIATPRPLETNAKPKPVAKRRRPPEPPGFERFMDAYPRKDDIGHARPAWIKALTKADPDTIISGVKAYPFDPDPRYVALPTTWLNGERWLRATNNDGLDPTLKAAGVTKAELDLFMLSDAKDTFFGKGK